MNYQPNQMGPVTTIRLTQLMEALAEAERNSKPEEAVRFSIFRKKSDGDHMKLELNRGPDGKWTLANPVLLMP